MESYRDKIAYGFSLGAYGALYYTSPVNCRILALSPRLSIHPQSQYGKVQDAKAELEEAMLKFGKTKALLKRSKEINEFYFDRKYIEGG